MSVYTENELDRTNDVSISTAAAKQDCTSSGSKAR
jgi:hypothetical protein